MDPVNKLIVEHRISLKILFWMVFILVLLFCLHKVGPIITALLSVVSPFIVAFIIAYVLFPIVRLVQVKLKLGRLAGILTMVFIFWVVSGILMGVLLPVLYQQLRLVIYEVGNPDFLNGIARKFLNEDLRKDLLDFLAPHLIGVENYIRENLGTIGGVVKPMAEGGLSAVKGVAGGVLKGVNASLNFFSTTLLIIIISFYYLADMEKIPPIIQRMLPAEKRESIWGMLLKSDKAIGGFLRGQLTACTGVAILASTMLFFTGLKQYAILIGCFAGLMNFIPYLGPVAGATPALLWVLLNNQMASWDERGIYVLIIIVIFAVIQLVDGFIFQPYIVGSQASLHPLAVMFSLIVGAQAGLIGIIVAVPIASMVKVFWVELYWSRLPELSGNMLNHSQLADDRFHSKPEGYGGQD
jgi:predicted PurR-regulated permease PerM